MLRLNLRNIQKILTNRLFYTATRLRKDEDNGNKKEEDLSSSTSTRFQVFRNENVGMIFDIEEERAKKRLEEETGIVEEIESPKALPRAILDDINLERGKTGVYDIEDLVDVLRKENAIDLCVIRIPKEHAYVDYMCIVTGSSYRHMLGMANFVRRIYKSKRNQNDLIPKIEGKECKNWMAMDLGNIALHIFSKSARKYYNLEILWTLGSDYEKRSVKIELKEELYQEFMTMTKENLIVEDDQKIEKIKSER